jgi:hypothetical protein
MPGPTPRRARPAPLTSLDLAEPVVPGAGLVDSHDLDVHLNQEWLDLRPSRQAKVRAGTSTLDLHGASPSQGDWLRPNK